MLITVYGAGAIGGITGAALAGAGHDVLLVDSAVPHVDAINVTGLTVERDGATTTTRVRAVTPAGLGRDLELVLLAVKSQHTRDALSHLAPRLAATGTIVSLQNGLSEEAIAHAVGTERTVGCLVNWAADWVAPGRIAHGGHGAFVLGELDGRITPRVRELAELLGAVESTRVTDNILGYKWAKLIYASVLFATAVVDAHVYEVVERSPDVQQALGALVGEGLAVADKAGVRIDAFDEFDPAWYRAALGGDEAALRHAMATAAAHYRGNTKTKTGVWRDLAVRRRKTEVDGLLGVLVEKGEGLGVAMPVTRRLIEIIRDLEEGRRQMDWANLDPLVALVGQRPRRDGD
ncbi:MAG TPA: 2-dehydropantoate 2-reductase [Candidatus Methylomirabilis sp.]|nr:2-dehydropantoate 2-reductase [Candidatus Methylomirabilis sp.]